MYCDFCYSILWCSDFCFVIKYSDARLNNFFSICDFFQSFDLSSIVLFYKLTLMEYFITIIRPSQSFLLFWFGSGQGCWLCGGMYMYYYNYIRLHSNNLLLHKKNYPAFGFTVPDLNLWFQYLIFSSDYRVPGPSLSRIWVRGMTWNCRTSSDRRRSAWPQNRGK